MDLSMLRRVIPFVLPVIFLFTGCVHRIPASPGAVEVWFLDVGYGDATVIRHEGWIGLVDGGYPVMTGCLMDFFHHAHIDHLDAVILTHPHPDHIGGLYGVLASGMPVTRVYGCYPLDHPEIPVGYRMVLQDRDLPHELVYRGDTIPAGGGLRLEVLHPEIPGPDLNESSMVLHLSGPGGGLLLTADIGPIAQESLARYGNIRAGVLKAPHHGGEGYGGFAEAVHPLLIFISVGINPYNNPRPETIRAYRESGATLLRSDETGSVRVVLFPDGTLDWTPVRVPRGTPCTR